MSAKKSKSDNRKQPSQQPKEANPMIEYGLLILFGIFLVLFTTFKITGDDDVFWHLATGRYIVETGHVPSVDIFGFVTQGQQWMPFEWGWDVLTYALYNIGGYTALSILRTVIFVLIFWILYVILKKFKVSTFLTVLFFIILAFGIMDRLTPRPHVISMLFFAVLLYIFFDFRYFRRGTGKLIYFLPLVFLIWANMHMGILAGLFLFGIYITSEIFIYFGKSNQGVSPLSKKQLQMLTALFGMSILAALVNPNFFQTYVYAYDHTKMKLLETINEWRSPFDPVYGGGFVTNIYKFFLFGGLIILYYSMRKKDYFPALVYIGFAIYSVRAVRFTVDYIVIIFVFFVIALDFILAEFSKEKLNSIFRSSPLPSIIVMVMLAYLIFNIPNNKLYLEQLQYYRVSGFGINSDFIPVQMFDFMREHKIPQTGQRPLNHFGSGGYLVWNFPESKNFIDSRNLNDDIFGEYNTLIAKRPGFENKLKQYDFDYAIYLAPDLVRAPAEMEQTIISYFSKKQDDWKLVFWDDKSFLFLKNLPKFKEIIDKYEYKYVTPYNFGYQKQSIENGMKNDPARVKSEIDRKLSTEPNGVIINTIQNSLTSKLNR
ncbi:MAG: hypothetical protein WBC65_08615 [Ignavibacteria bacterium]